MSAQKIETRAISSLSPYERNARTHSPEQVKQLAASIEKFGFTNPVLVTKDGMIVAGHGRVEAAMTLGLKDVPVIVVGKDWTEDQLRAYVLADNQLALNAGWDKDLLAIELKELNDVGFDIALTGFDEVFLEKTLGLGEIEAPAEFDEFDEDIKTDHECPKCGFKWSGKTE